ncbi:MAG: large conductance mechanosensitive channel protein MscL [Eubacteriales bacterium]
MKNGKGFITEFKTFVTRGNVFDLAVGVIIGGAFKSIVDSLVADVIMPVISIITGGINFSNLFFNLTNKEKYETLALAQADGVSTLNYGNFISKIINFIIMAFVIFMLVKFLNVLAETGKKRIKKGQQPEPEPITVKDCPFCKSTINIEAIRCPNCTSELT